MTPVPIDLPLRPSEAASLAALIFEQVNERRLSEDIRTRLAGRASTLGLKTIAPYFGSLEADPIHPATYYLAVDGLAGAEPAHLLLHMSPASSPASGIFPKPLLIGRMRPSAGREIVMNAIAFGPQDSNAVSAYATQVSKAFLPRAHGALPLVWIDTGGAPFPAVEALLGFRAHLRSSGLNIAGLRLPSGSGVSRGPQPRPDDRGLAGAAARQEAEAAVGFWQMVWAAIRAGFREGYSLAGPYEQGTAKLLSCFRVCPGEIVEAFHHLRSVRGGIPFDLELDLAAGGSAEVLEGLKREGVTPQFVLAPGEATIHGALPSIEVPARPIEQAREARARFPGPAAVTIHWDGSEPPISLLLEALR